MKKNTRGKPPLAGAEKPPANGKRGVTQLECMDGTGAVSLRSRAVAGEAEMAWIFRKESRKR